MPFGDDFGFFMYMMFTYRPILSLVLLWIGFLIIIDPYRTHGFLGGLKVQLKGLFDIVGMIMLILLVVIVHDRYLRNYFIF